MENICHFISLSNNDDIICIMGDFNLPNIKWKADFTSTSRLYPCNVTLNEEQIICDGMQSLNLWQICTIPNQNSKYLDLVFMCDSNYGFISKSLDPFVDERLHHFGIELNLDCKEIFCKFINKTKPSLIFNFKKADFIGLKNHLDLIDWDIIMPLNVDLNSSVETFYSILHSSFEKFVPKCFNSVCNSHPWFDKSLINLRNRKNQTS